MKYVVRYNRFDDCEYYVEMFDDLFTANNRVIDLSSAINISNVKLYEAKEIPTS